MAKLTKQDCINFPANFLYVWATDAFLKQMDAKSARIIRAKAANQKKLLKVLCDADTTQYNSLVKQISDSFNSKYGCTPVQALVTLAEGGEIAGKNWKEGGYGIGATGRSNFAQNTAVTVDPDTGVISYNGAAQDCTPVYNKKGVATNYTAVIGGNTYSSIYDKSTGKYYAYQYCPGDGDGTKQNASGEQLLIGNMTNSMWQDILSITSTVGDWILKFVQAFVTMFGGTTTTTVTATSSPITAANTTPKQSDGFVYKSSSTGILAIAGAAALLLFARRKKRD